MGSKSKHAQLLTKERGYCFKKKELSWMHGMAHHTFPGLVQSYSIMAQCELSLSRPESFDQLRCNLPQQLAS
jgi:hypothetical protein